MALPFPLPTVKVENIYIEPEPESEEEEPTKPAPSGPIPVKPDPDSSFSSPLLIKTEHPFLATLTAPVSPSSLGPARAPAPAPPPNFTAPTPGRPSRGPPAPGRPHHGRHRLCDCLSAEHFLRIYNRSEAWVTDRRGMCKVCGKGFVWARRRWLEMGGRCWWYERGHRGEGGEDEQGGEEKDGWDGDEDVHDGEIYEAQESAAWQEHLYGGCLTHRRQETVHFKIIRCS